MTRPSQVRVYDPTDSVVFLKTKERFGGLSNMAAGYPLNINGIDIRTSEALYQACRFPHMPGVQRRIIAERSPMTAKMRGKPFRSESRPDWDSVRVRIMRWCLRVKLAQNWNEFGRLLLNTGDRPIVERSKRDSFWGAKDVEDGTLVGMNVLGRLLMELRERLKADTSKNVPIVEPLSIPQFLLFGEPIQIIRTSQGIAASAKVQTDEVSAAPPAILSDPPQPSLFELPIVSQPEPLAIGLEGNSHQSVLEPYARYRDSGVPWLGSIPVHWKIERAKWLFRKMERPVRGCDEVVTCFRDGVVTLRKNRRLRGFTESLAEHGYQGIRRGDLVIHAMDAFAGATGVSDSDGKGTSVYSVCSPRTKNIDAHYYAYCFREMARNLWILALSKGIRERSTDFRFLTMASQSLPFPPPAEQTAIVRFLDHADRRIRRYIRAKEELIALLEEQKQAIIHQAVTGRIDVRTGQPYPAYKPSGIEWLGDVPAHWNTRRLKFLASIPSGQVDPRLEEHRHKMLVAPNHILPGSGKLTDLTSADEQGADSGKYEIRVGDVIYSKIRPNLRKAAISSVSGLCSADMYPIRVREAECHPSFFLQLLLSDQVTKYTVDCSLRVAMPKVNREALGNCWLAYPPIAEQMAILGKISNETVHLELVIKNGQREIVLLREYRTRLIADVVTGKLDVREAAAALPKVDRLAVDDEADDPLNAGVAPALDDDHEVAEVVG